MFTARKQSFRRLCFYRCLSVHRGACAVGGVDGRGRAWQRVHEGSVVGGCMAGGCVWQGDMHSKGGACVAGGHV